MIPYVVLSYLHPDRPCLVSQASWSVSEGDACINEAHQRGATQVNYIEEELPIVVVDKKRYL